MQNIPNIESDAAYKHFCSIFKCLGTTNEKMRFALMLFTGQHIHNIEHEYEQDDEENFLPLFEHFAPIMQTRLPSFLHFLQQAHTELTTHAIVLPRNFYVLPDGRQELTDRIAILLASSDARYTQDAAAADLQTLQAIWKKMCDSHIEQYGPRAMSLRNIQTWAGLNHEYLQQYQTVLNRLFTFTNKWDSFFEHTWGEQTILAFIFRAQKHARFQASGRAGNLSGELKHAIADQSAQLCIQCRSFAHSNKHMPNIY